MSRQSVIDNSAVMIGRNIYSQSLRQCALKPHTDGNYYSDCSSFASAAFMSAGYNVKWNNTYSFCEDKDFYTVPIIQLGKHIQNPASVLKVADVIIWPGHCNMVHHIDGNNIYVQDHGSGNPKIKLLTNSEEYHTGEIVVRRLKAFDEEEATIDTVEEEETSVVVPNSPLFKVQAGSFASENTAKTFCMKLFAKGFSGSYTVKKGSAYTVQCGAFKNQENASNLADLLRDAGFEAYVWLDE